MRKRSRFATLCLTLASLAVVLGGLEAACRLTVPLQPPMSRPDPRLVYRLLPNLSVAARSPGDFAVTYTTDERGFRRAGATAAAPSRRRRVLGLGDSFTFGVGVEDTETFLARLERELGSERVEVVNAGVPGWGTGQQLAFFEDEGEKLGPELVILGFYPNDVEESWAHGPYQLSEGGLRAMPTTELRSLSPFRSWVRELPLYSFLAARSSLLAWVRTRLALRETRRLGGLARGQGGSATPELKLQFEVALVDALAARVRASGARLLVLRIPSRQELEARGGEAGPFGAIRGALAARPIAWLDLREVFVASGMAASRLHFARDDHWTPEAHALAAKALAPKVRELLDREPGPGVYSR